VITVVDILAMQQDYAWFLEGLLCTAVMLGWYWLKEEQRSAWIPWSAVSGIALGLWALEGFIAPVEARPNKPVHLAEDILMAAAVALQIPGWAYQAFGRKPGIRRLAVPVSCLVVLVTVAVHFDHPLVGGSITALVLAFLGWAIVRRSKKSSCENWAILVAVVAAILSPVGPVAGLTDSLQRWTELSPVGFFSASLLVIGSTLLLISQFRGLSFSGRLGGKISIRDDIRPFAAALGIWLVLGLVAAVATARLARHEFESSAIGRVSAAAALFDTGLIEEALGPDFRPGDRPSVFSQPGGASTPIMFASSLTGERVALAETQLDRIAKAHPDVRFVYIETVYRGEEMIVLGPPVPKTYSGVVVSLRPLSETAAASWTTKRPYFEEPVTMSYGEVTFARAPLLGRNGEMLGWLSFVFGVSQWTATQAEARLLTFSVVALGTILGSLIFVQRIRGRDREVTIRLATAAEESNRLKTRFLANVSHELRTPIQTILGYAELLERTLEGRDEHARIRLLRRQGELMARLVNDLIDLAALESGDFRLIESPILFTRLVNDTLESMRPRALAKSLAFAITVSERVPAWVITDAARIQQIMINLVGNALKFTDHGGVEVLLDGACEDDGSCDLELRVRDSGPGIPFDEQCRLFQPFSRLNGTINREGAGLGLAIAAGLCRRLGGGLSCISDGRSGSTFRATFRLKCMAAPSASGAQNTMVSAGTRVLVADDNTLVRELFVAYLTELGAHCDSASDGTKALDKARTCTYQALILDLSMPGMDGYEVASRIRSDGGRERIIGVSAHAGTRERERALSSGMDEFLTKPVELAALAKALNLAPRDEPAPGSWQKLRLKWENDFRNEANQQASEVLSAIEASDWAFLNRRAHYLRNSAAVLRDDGLYSAFADLEAASGKEDSSGIIRAWERCLDALQPWSPEISVNFPRKICAGVRQPKKSEH
jgi:signal transduction histidine kinase/CheY-like chemotaxis protein